MNDEQLKIIMRNSSPQVDSILLDKFSIKDLDPISVSSFKEKVTSRYPNNGYETLNPEDFLIEHGIMRRNRNTNDINITRGGRCLSSKLSDLTIILFH